jgi:hypothetical protein
VIYPKAVSVVYTADFRRSLASNLRKKNLDSSEEQFSQTPAIPSQFTLSPHSQWHLEVQAELCAAQSRNWPSRPSNAEASLLLPTLSELVLHHVQQSLLHSNRAVE